MVELKPWYIILQNIFVRARGNALLSLVTYLSVRKTDLVFSVFHVPIQFFPFEGDFRFMFFFSFHVSQGSTQM